MSFMDQYLEKQEERRRLRSERKNKFLNGSIPKTIDNIEDFLETWTELEDVTTEKNKEKAYFILRDREEGFKLYFWKSGFVKKQSSDGSHSLFLNNWNYSIEDIVEGKMHPYSLNFLIYHAHQFMISKKILNNVETYFSNKSFRDNMLKRGGFSYIDDHGNERWVV